MKDTKHITISSSADPERMPIEDVEEFLEEIAERAKELEILRKYLDHRRCAMELRLAGDIPKALLLETGCDESFPKLPRWAKGPLFASNT